MVERCANTTNKTCSTSKEIDDWTSSKQIKTVFYDQKLDSKEFDKTPIYHQKKYFEIKIC